MVLVVWRFGILGFRLGFRVWEFRGLGFRGLGFGNLGLGALNPKLFGSLRAVYFHRDQKV